MVRLLDGPKNPDWLEMIYWTLNPNGQLEKYAKLYGDIYNVKLGTLGYLTIISSPPIIQEIFNGDGKIFDSGRTNGILSTLVGKDSMLLLDGDRHKTQRKLLMPPFHGERLQSYGNSICQITQQIMDNLPSNRPFIARRAMQEITLEIILQVVFGLSQGKHYQTMKSLIAEILEATASPLRASFLFFKILQQDWGEWSPWGRMMAQRRKLYDLLQAEIEDKRNQNQLGKDILSLMIAARDEDGESMTDAEIKDNLMTLLVAGHETTATALSWALYWTHSLPEVKEKLLREIDNLGENPDPMVIAKLPYLSATCQETLRLYPVAMFAFSRLPKEPVEIEGYHFDEKSALSVSIYSLHQREDLYPNPKQFRPERFLERQYSPFEYIPFGGGTRRCLGYALAQLELKLVLAHILSHYDLSLAETQPVKPQRRGLTLAPAGGVKMIKRCEV